MKNFFKEHSYDMLKMFLNQFATAIFGFSLAVAAGKAENATLRNVTSIGAIIFYLFLLYTMCWDIGFKDRIPVAHGLKKRMPYKGALISLCANSINILFALFITLAKLIPVEFLGNIGAFCQGAAVILEGMYVGLLANSIGGAVLNGYWFMYFIIVLPAILTCLLAYYLGLKDVKFTSLFNQPYPESDREPKQKRDRRDDR